MKRISIVFICIVFVTLAGCWDKHEVNEITIVTGLALDRGEKEKYRLTLEIINPPALDPQMAGDTTASVVFSLEGQSFAELANKMNIGYTRNPKFSHMKVLVISKEIAKEGLLEFIDYMERSREIRNDFNVVISEGPAADILKVTYHIQRVSGLKLHSQFKTMVEEWGGEPDIRMREIVNAFISKGIEPTAAVVSIRGEAGEGNMIENIHKVDPDAIVVLDGLAVFNGFHYQGRLAVRDARNVLWLRDKLQSTSFSLTCDKEKVATIRVTNSQTRVHATYEGHVPTFLVDIAFEGRIDSTQCPDDLTDRKVYQKYEALAANAVKEELEKTIEMLQHEFKADIVGFGEHMERQAYPQFQAVKKDWNSEFTKSSFKVKVNPKLRRSGLTKEPFLHKMKEE